MKLNCPVNSAQMIKDYRGIVIPNIYLDLVWLEGEDDEIVKD
jgi:hypothetical protein